ncbi:hypothetical protein [Streptomyces seoulensis]|uniref:hypothetical protein n=1 Tax=Streptomyces seoulensis TaxID=73044 RepID=UPI001FCAFE1F|nr:hypothetical protein [Streptomyces seoulensis]BDH07234.1 hypothetical protein HEK131_44610 [Streptomyces seoulensis]
MRPPQDLPTNPARLRLQYSHRHRLLDSPQEQTLEQWDVLIQYQSDDGTSHDVGTMVFHRVRLTQGMNAWMAMEEESEELFEIGNALLDPATGYFTPEAEQRLEYVGTNLLIMERVTLAPAWRGFGLGPILAAEAINRLSPGVRAVACSPGISAHEEGWLPEQAEFDQINAKIAAAWKSVGFTPYRANVYLLPLATQIQEDQLAGLQTHFHDLCSSWADAHAG